MNTQLEYKKPNEPVILLILAILAIVIGLNLNFVSFKYFNITVYYYKGMQIIEAVVFFGLSALFAFAAFLIYYFGKTQNSITISRNVTILGILSGIAGTLLIFLGFYHFFSENTDPAINQLLLSSHVLTPDIGVVVCLGGIFLMMIAVYMLHTTKLTSETKESALYPDMTNVALNDDFTIEDLKALWYCTNDRSKLEMIVNRTVPNPEFRISQERLDDNLNNAVAMRKLPPELVPYAKTLALVLFKKAKHPDIELVSTVCSSCRAKYVCPRLSDWYD